MDDYIHNINLKLFKFFSSIFYLLILCIRVILYQMIYLNFLVPFFIDISAAALRQPKEAHRYFSVGP